MVPYQLFIYTIMLHHPEVVQKLECMVSHTTMFYPKENFHHFNLLPICLNQGYCVDFGRLDGGYTNPTCYCKMGFYGEHCEYQTEETSRKIRDSGVHVKAPVSRSVELIDDEILETKES